MRARERVLLCPALLYEAIATGTRALAAYRYTASGFRPAHLHGTRMNSFDTPGELSTSNELSTEPAHQTTDVNTGTPHESACWHAGSAGRERTSESGARSSGSLAQLVHRVDLRGEVGQCSHLRDMAKLHADGEQASRSSASAARRCSRAGGQGAGGISPHEEAILRLIVGRESSSSRETVQLLRLRPPVEKK